MHAQYIVKRKLLGRLCKFRHRNSVLTLIKKRMLISEVKINILSGYLSSLSTSENSSPDLISLRLSWSTQISLQFKGIWRMLPSSRAFLMLCLIVAIRANFQRYLQWYYRIVFLDLLYRFFCAFCLDLHIKFDFCHFILCRRRCICVVGTCSMNLSEGERFTLFCGIAHLCFATIFGNFSSIFLYLCELLFLHYSHNFLFPSRADPGFVLLCKRRSRICFL